MLLGLFVYGYATRVHSSRKIERACHDSVAFCFVVANTKPIINKSERGAREAAGRTSTRSS